MPEVLTLGHRKTRYETYFFGSVIPCRVALQQSPTPFHGTNEV